MDGTTQDKGMALLSLDKITIKYLHVSDCEIAKKLREKIRFTKTEIFRNALLVVFVLLSNGIKAQLCDTSTKSYPGTVIFRAEKKKEIPGSQLHGCIKLMGEQEMYVAPNLVDSLGKSHRYFGREALAYWYIYNEDTIYYLNSGSNLHLYKWIYLKRIVKGPMELYLYRLQGTSVSTLSRTEYSYYYLRKDNKWLNEKAIVWNEGGKRKRMQKIFSDCQPALEMISKTTNLELDEILPQLVNLYNTSSAALNKK